MAEQLYFSHGKVRVDSNWAVFGEKAYPLSDIQSASVRKRPIQPLLSLPRWVSLSLAVIVLLVFLTKLVFGKQLEGTFFDVVYNLAFLLLMLRNFQIIVDSFKPSHAVQLESKSGKVDAFSTNSDTYIQEIANAINAAIHDRGRPAHSSPT